LALTILFQSSALGFGKAAALFSAGKGHAALLVNPYLVAMVGAHGLQAIAWFLALRSLPLSVAYPITATSFILQVLTGWLVFGETVGLLQVAGIVLITLGSSLVASRAAS